MSKPARLTRALVAVGAALALGASVACCQQVLSIDGPVVIGGTVSACGIPVSAGACEQCVASQCCTQAAACAGDPACLALETCLLGCASDYACRSRCVETNPVGGQTDVPTLDTCVAASCDDACGMLCGTSGSYTEPDAAQACQQCIEAYACTPTLDCTTNLDCQLTGHCAYACVTPDCSAACLAQGSGDAFTNTALQVGLPCYSACRVGHYWRCAGHFSWPFAKSTSQKATLTLMNPDANQQARPYPGLTVHACSSAEPDCTTVLGSGTSDANGVATVGLPPLPSRAFGFQGYFDVASTGETIPYLFFLAFPLSEADAQLTLPIPTALDVKQSMDLVHVAALPQHGHIAVIAQDCLLVNAPAVTITADGLNPEAQRFYFSGGQPSATATSTDVSGVAYFYNVAPGQYTLHVTNDQGQATSLERVLVRAGALSVVVAIPTPL